MHANIILMPFKKLVKMHGEKQMYYTFASCRLQPGGEWLAEISTVHNYKYLQLRAIELPTECLEKDVVKHPHSTAA